MNKRVKKRLKLMLLTIAVLISGLLFYCVSSSACEATTDTLYFMPRAGFDKYMSDLIYYEVHKVTIEETESELDVIYPTYYLTDREADLLLRVAVLEAGGTDPKSIGMVMQVVLNRVASPNFPNTIEEVIFQKDPIQFTTASKLATANITPEAYVALDSVIFGEFQWCNYLYFESDPNLRWKGWCDYVTSYGGHDFYI